MIIGSKAACFRASQKENGKCLNKSTKFKMMKCGYTIAKKILSLIDEEVSSTHLTVV